MFDEMTLNMHYFGFLKKKKKIQVTSGLNQRLSRLPMVDLDHLTFILIF